MDHSTREILILLIIGCSLSLPGHIARWIKYRTLGDVLIIISCVFLISASAWQVWSNVALDPLKYSDTILFSRIILWCITALCVAMTYLEIQVVHPKHFKRRLRGKKWWERTLFGIGFVDCGCDPEEIESSIQPQHYSDEEPDRSHKGKPYFIGGAFLCLIWFGSMFFTFNDQRIFRLFIMVLTFGVVLIAGGAIDWFVVASRGYSPKKKITNNGYCSKCGYDLRGLTEPRCPECGKSF